MKHYYKIVLTLTLSLLLGFSAWGQLVTGDIAFTAFNADGNDDFAIVALADIPANSTIYFTDEESNGAGAFVGTGEGFLNWNTGGALIPAGTVVVFTDVGLTSRSATFGTVVIEAGGGAFNLAAGGDVIFAYTGTDPFTPTTFIAGIQNEPNNFGNLANTGLVEGTTFVTFNDPSGNANPDGGAYNGPRSGLGSFAAYRAATMDYTNWSRNDTNGEALLPYDTTAFIVIPTWTGATDNDWATATNWSTGSVPSASDNVIIPNSITNYPTISSAVTVNSMQIASGASVIANAAVTGNVTYTRNLPTTNWYLVSAPVSGETQEDVIANHTFATGTGSNIGIGAFTNNGASPWVYATAATTGALTSGLGVSMKLAAAGDVTITGTMNSSNVIFPVNTGTRNNFNLVGNPFTSYVNSATFASANTGLLSEETVWLWNGTAYVTYNAMTPIEIAPAQGFFVDASGAGNVTFATSNQSHQGTDTFLRQEPNPSFELFVDNGTENTSTKVFYANNKSAGFDNGYDSKMFGGIAKDFAVYTQLVANDQGNKLAIQTLPNADHATMVIPVGLIAKAGEEITFSITSANLPNGIDIYLEDRVNNTFVNLSEGDHTITTKSALNGIGQYYIHANSAKLSNSDIAQNIDNVSIYKSSKNEITVAGLQAQANVKVFSLLGEELINTDINSSGVSKVALPNLSTGVYVVKLNSVLGNITKKIILE